VYARKLDVINRGLSGYNTTWAIPCFEQCLVPSSEQHNRPKIRILIIWFGANDACVPPSPQHVPLGVFKDNLSHIINLVKSPGSRYHSPNTEILLLTPPPINTFQRAADLQSRDPPLDLDRKFEVTQAYAESVKDIAKTYSVHLVDIFGAVWNKVNHDEKALSKYLGDGLHFTPAGYEVTAYTL
jgi:lysophospholipase L1-like esterase